VTSRGPCALAVVVTLLAASCGSGGDRSSRSRVASTSPPLQGRILFDCGSQLCVVNADGTGERQLTHKTVRLQEAQHARWSPDGRKIAFTGLASYGTSPIYVINADGTGQRRLTRYVECCPSWSPDGTKIAFTKEGTNTEAAWVMNADGSGERRLAAGEAVEPTAWTPDSKAVLLSVDARLLLVTVDGGRKRELPKDVEDAAWSPDAKRLLLNARSGLYVANANLSARRRLAREAMDPEWSPDGKKVAFAAVPSDVVYLYVVNADGTGRHVVADHIENFSWSPDGIALAFDDGVGAIDTAFADGSGRRPLTDSGVMPKWEPRGP
jgi:Tol biopolymer transport system component